MKTSEIKEMAELFVNDELDIRLLEDFIEDELVIFESFVCQILRDMQAKYDEEHFRNHGLNEPYKACKKIEFNFFKLKKAKELRDQNIINQYLIA